MKKLISTLFLISPLTAMAAPGDMSFGLSLGQQKYTDTVNSFKPATIEGTFSYGVLNNLDVQLLVGKGLSKKPLGSTEAEISSYYGAFIKPYVQLSQLKVYGLLGAVRTTIKTTTSSGSYKGSDTSFAYGLGGAYAITKNLDVKAEWKQIYKKDSEKISGPSVGVDYNF